MTDGHAVFLANSCRTHAWQAKNALLTVPKTCYIVIKGKNRKLHAVVFDAGPGVLMLNMSGGGFFISGTKANFGTGQILDHAQFPYPWSKICPVLKFGLVLKIKNHQIYVPRSTKIAGDAAGAAVMTAVALQLAA